MFVVSGLQGIIASCYELQVMTESYGWGLIDLRKQNGKITFVVLYICFKPTI